VVEHFVRATHGYVEAGDLLVLEQDVAQDLDVAVSALPRAPAKRAPVAVLVAA